MRAVSVDLPWARSGEAAVAIVHEDGWVTWGLCDYPDGLIAVLGKLPCALVLLDIPIYGLEKLQGNHFRPIDNALLSVGISIRPTSSAKLFGPKLVDRIVAEAGVSPCRIQEIYPYAVYKWLAYVRALCAFPLPNHAQTATLLGDDFPSYFPLPYKRRSHRGTRRQGMEVLYNLLTDADLGLHFDTPLPSPDSTAYSLKRLSDVYDATLGAVLGLHLLREDGWAMIWGDRKHGDMALLADAWLTNHMDDFLGSRRRGESSCLL